MFRSPFPTVHQCNGEYRNVFTIDGAAPISWLESSLGEIAPIELRSLTSKGFNASKHLILILHEISVILNADYWKHEKRSSLCIITCNHLCSEDRWKLSKDSDIDSY